MQQGTAPLPRGAREGPVWMEPGNGSGIVASREAPGLAGKSAGAVHDTGIHDRPGLLAGEPRGQIPGDAGVLAEESLSGSFLSGRSSLTMVPGMRGPSKRVLRSTWFP